MAETDKTKNENSNPNAETKSEQKPVQDTAPPVEAGQTVPSPQTQPLPTVPAPPAPAEGTPAAAPAAVEPEKPKSRAWLWLLGGCLVLLIIFLAGLGILGWLGIKQVKSVIQKYEPTIQDTQKNIDRMNQEASQWEKKSQEVRDSMPNPEDLKDMTPKQY